MYSPRLVWLWAGCWAWPGSFASQPYLRNIAWEIDGLGLVVATSLLTLKFFRKGNDFAAAGFLVFAIGESVMLGGQAAGLDGSVPAFAAGAALWATALLLISIPKLFPLWVRLVGIASAILFGITATKIYWGQPLSPISTPLPTIAYPLFVLTFLGWILTLLKEA